MRTLTVPFDAASLARAARLVADGQPVAVPTETVYGLAADATSPAAVAAIYAAKGRPSFNPLIVHVVDHAMARRLAVLDETARRLAAAFWPGPLTLVLPRAPGCPVADLATAGLPTIAIRMPAHPAMRALIEAAGVPLAAPSANRSGAISPTRAEHVALSLGGHVALILDAGPTPDGIESTIVAVSGAGITLLRPGPIDAQALTQAAGVPVRARAEGQGITAPGQLASHYAPAKPLALDQPRPGPDAFHIGFGDGPCQRNLSPAGNLIEAAANLFAALHEADASAFSRITVAPIPMTGIGLAINDRLARAAA